VLLKWHHRRSPEHIQLLHFVGFVFVKQSRSYAIVNPNLSQWPLPDLSISLVSVSSSAIGSNCYGCKFSYINSYEGNRWVSTILNITPLISTSSSGQNKDPVLTLKHLDGPRCPNIAWFSLPSLLTLVHLD
jgi:hypothetical protein